MMEYKMVGSKDETVNKTLLISSNHILSLQLKNVIKDL